MTYLLAHVENTVRRRGLLRPGERILVAVSGGLDSMVLLRVLHALAAQQGWTLAVAHLNHQLRGRSSGADERLVRRTAEQLGLPVFVERATVRAFARTHKLSLEMAARQVRHEFLARTAANWKSRTIALAHHADDQVELFFVRLFRGTGGEGLQGMKWRSPSPAGVRSSAFRRSGDARRWPAGRQIELLRPLLDVPRATLAAHAREQNIQFREDASNASLDILRNRIRHELLPLLTRDYQPALARTVSRAMEIVGTESAFVRDAAAAWLRGKRASNRILSKSGSSGRESAQVSRRLERTHVRCYGAEREAGFKTLPTAVRRAVIRQQLLGRGVVPDFELVESLVEAADRRVSVGMNVSVWRDATGHVSAGETKPLRFRHTSRMIELKGRAGECSFGGLRIRWQITYRRGDSRPARADGQELFDAAAVGSPVILRHWQPGDRFQPIGLAQSVKLQDLLTNARIPRGRKRELVVAVAADGRIFWVEGLRIAEPFKLTPQTIRRLQWRWERLE